VAGTPGARPSPLPPPILLGWPLLGLRGCRGPGHDARASWQTGRAPAAPRSPPEGLGGASVVWAVRALLRRKGDGPADLSNFGFPRVGPPFLNPRLRVQEGGPPCRPKTSHYLLMISAHLTTSRGPGPVGGRSTRPPEYAPGPPKMTPPWRPSTRPCFPASSQKTTPLRRSWHVGRHSLLRPPVPVCPAQRVRPLVVTNERFPWTRQLPPVNLSAKGTP
jgi:hypothetical protein